MQRTYSVSFPCIFTINVEAESPAEAAEWAESYCPNACTIDGAAFVWRTNEAGHLIEWDEDFMELPDYDDAEERGE